MFGFKKGSENKENINAKPLTVSTGNPLYIEVPYEYPFSMKDDDLRKKVKEFIDEYNQMYRATTSEIYIKKGRYQNPILSKIEDLESLINQGNNELSRRTNEKILIGTLVVAGLTLFVTIVSCVVTIKVSGFM